MGHCVVKESLVAGLPGGRHGGQAAVVGPVDHLQLGRHDVVEQGTERFDHKVQGTGD